MLLLELFAGMKSVWNVAKNFWYDIISLDIDSDFNCDLTINILDFNPADYNFIPNIIWASPDCTSFSIAAAWFHRRKSENYKPRTQKAIEWDKIIIKLISIIDYYLDKNPSLIWFIENPRGMLQKMDYMQKLEKYKRLVTYCQYWWKTMKPTNIWTNFFPWYSKPICKRWDSCHESSPRCTFKNWILGIKNAKERSIIPKWLIEDIFTQLNIYN